MRRLFEKGFGRDDVLALFRFIDGLIAIPEELETEFRTRLRRHQEQKNMPYVTSIERLARKEGLEEGLEKGLEKGALGALRAAILEVLEVRFGKLPPTLPSALDGVKDQDVLRTLVRDAACSESLAAFGARISRRMPGRHSRRARARRSPRC